jgi:hypothetical protein
MIGILPTVEAIEELKLDYLYIKNLSKNRAGSLPAFEMLFHLTVWDRTTSCDGN